MNILILGGTGSFGHGAVEYLLKNKTVEKYGHKYFYDKICIYSRDEHKQELMQHKFNDSRLRFWLGDVRDKDRLQMAVNDATHIIHAAALKIVPSAEYSPFEYIKTNVLGSQNLIDCCLNSPIAPSGWPKVIALSTDKAVMPINLYGATKLCMEKMFFAANNIRGEYGPKFSVVRYGNVCGSNGSVIPLFARLKKEGEPLQITDIAMTRFWLRLEEAVEFTFNSLNKMQGNELFIPNMPSFRVLELAKAFGHMYQFSGIRPGEKIHENLFTEDECEKYNISTLPKSSGENNVWMSVKDIKTELKEMGYL